MVKTNIGLIPESDYLDMMAMQYGFENYEDMRSEGYYIELPDNQECDKS